MSSDDDDDDDREDLAGGRTPAEIRAEAMSELRTTAAALFEKNPGLRSVMMGVAQYWADEADDAVHTHLVASERSIPVWPHSCDMTWDDEEDKELARIPGEACWECAEGFDGMDLDSNGAAIVGFEAFCHENGSQEESEADNHRPYAIARRVDGSDEIAIEIVGMRVRTDGHAEPMAGEESEMASWPDARAQELFALVCASPADDVPRHVLADHLQERGDPRGEYLALALGATDADGRARRDELFAEHRNRWIDPLGMIIPEDGARFERGFLVHADLYAPDAESLAELRGAAAWGTLESVRFLDGSLVVLDPAMVALREVGIVHADGIDQLFASTRPWAIESMTIANPSRESLVALQRTTLLPRLRHLGFYGDLDLALELLPSAWWSQLERVTVYDRKATTFDARFGSVPVVAFAESDDDLEPIGWQLAFHRDGGVEVTMAGFHGDASFPALGVRLAALPPGAGTITLAPSRYYQPVQLDAERLAALAGRAVGLRGGAIAFHGDGN